MCDFTKRRVVLVCGFGHALAIGIFWFGGSERNGVFKSNLNNSVPVSGSWQYLACSTLQAARGTRGRGIRNFWRHPKAKKPKIC
jgi:hypothetical protein